MNNVAMIIGKRLGLGVLTMFMVSIIIFLAVNMLPGDFRPGPSRPVGNARGGGRHPQATSASNKPIHTRYFDWLDGAHAV